MMQTQLAGAMAKAELEANQTKLLSSSRAYRTSQQRQQQPRHPGGATTGRTDVDRHSFAFEKVDEQQLLLSYGSDYLTAQRSSAAANGFMDDVFIPQPRLRPQSASTMNRPRSVIEGGDLSSIFNNNGGGWSFKQAGGMVAGGNPGAGGRPKSADISNWSFGLGTGGTSDTPPTWGALSPTVSTFERGKTIERPNSASDIDQHVPSILSGGGNWGTSRNVMLSEDTTRFPRRRNGQATSGTASSSNSNNNNNSNTIPGTDERQVADIVLSMYDDDGDARDGAGPLPQKSTSTSSANALRSSPVPSSSNSATLSPYWEATRSPCHPPSTANGFGKFLNPNDRLQDPDYDYLSDHSESSNVSARRHQQQQQHHHSRYNNNNQHRKKSFGQRGGGGGSGAKEKKYTDVVDMELLQGRYTKHIHVTLGYSFYFLRHTFLVAKSTPSQVQLHF